MFGSSWIPGRKHGWTRNVSSFGKPQSGWFCFKAFVIEFGGVVSMCGRSCARTLLQSSCAEKPVLCGWVRGGCDAGGCRSASGSAGWCRWAGRRAARAPPPTDTRDTAEGQEREK